VLEKPPQHLVCLLILSAAALYNEVFHFLCVCIETSSPNLASTARNIFFEATPTPHQQNTYVIVIPFSFFEKSECPRHNRHHHNRSNQRAQWQQ
jgi:hypothetical protein